MTLLLRAYALAAPLLGRVLLDRRRTRGQEHPERWPERLGRTDAARPEGRLAWLHGASVGEGLSLLPLAAALRTEDPALSILLTTGTQTSAALLSDRLPEGVHHQFAPIDTPDAARRFLDHWRPALAVFAESEVWPNMLAAARKRGVPAALVSARLSEKSVAGWRRVASTARALFSRFDWVLAQDDAGAHRLSELGARDDGRLNLKAYGAPLPIDSAAVAAAQAALRGRPVIVAASTHAGEEGLVLRAFSTLDHPDAFLILVPRHPERGAEVAALAEREGFTAGLRSAGDRLDGRGRLYIADTLGELGSWFALSEVRAAIVGGGFVQGPGGHNPLEPIRQGVPVITGPNVDNWRSVYGLVSEAVLTADDSDELAACLRLLLVNPVDASARTIAAQAALKTQTNALPDVARRLLALAGLA